MVSCSGTLTVLYLLSCSMPSIVYEGEAIKPVLSCSDGSVPFDIAFSGYFPNWDNPAEGNYAVLAEANCGQGALPKVSCGTLTVKATRFTFTDTRNNKTYKAVAIGTQTWMAENLNYDTSDSKCYNNDPANCEIYGRLYNWSTASTVCPTGWHIPSDAEWDVLITAVGGSSTAGTKLKVASGWSNNCNGTDDPTAGAWNATTLWAGATTISLTCTLFVACRIKRLGCLHLAHCLNHDSLDLRISLTVENNV